MYFSVFLQRAEGHGCVRVHPHRAVCVYGSSFKGNQSDINFISCLVIDLLTSHASYKRFMSLINVLLEAGLTT